MEQQIPPLVKERLLFLMRFLEHADENKPITSAEIEARTGWASHTIRKDISFLGSTAAGGLEDASQLTPELNCRISSSGGYDPASLVSLIKRTLGFNKTRKICVVGLGRLGSAYLNMPELAGTEFELVAGFDINVNRTEILKSTVPLYPAYKMGEVISRFGIEIALLCVPSDAAQTSAERLAAAGIRGILNFAPVHLAISPEIAVRNVNLTDDLRALSIKL